MPVTLSDIARELGVSKMTVSRAINDHPAINRETRDRVLAVARRLKYEPNLHARALATNRSYLIGVVVPDLMHSYFAEIIKGVAAVARPAGYQNLICETEEDAARELEEARALVKRTDGLVVATSLPPEKSHAYRKLVREGARLALVDRRLEGLRCPAVAVDNVRVGQVATEHLIDLGYETIGHLRGAQAAVAEDRYAGYMLALKKHKLSRKAAHVRECGFFEQDGFEAMRGWIAKGGLPSAVFAVNDPVAIGAIAALEEAGLPVPQTVAVVGAGNIHYADRLRVPLTTVAWDTSEIGRRAASLLIESIEDGGGCGERRTEVVRLEPSLVVRRSCGAQPAAHSHEPQAVNT